MRILHWPLAIVSLLSTAALAVEPTEFGMRARPAPTRMTDVFAPAVVRHAPENEACVVRLPDDTLRIFYIVRPEGTELRSIQSTDGGLTWQDDRLEFTLPGAAYHAIQVLVDRRGELQATFHIFRGEGRQPGVDRNLDLWQVQTTGGGRQWGTPQRIFEGYVGSIRGLIQLQTGRLLQPFARAVPERWQAPPEGEPDFGWHNITVLYSDDDGTSWQRSPHELKVQLCGPNVTRYGGVEPNVLEMRDGSIWMLIRDRCGRLYESRSHDRGVHWTEAARTQFISSDSPAWTLRLRDGRIVLFWCACQRWDNPRSYAMGGREVLHAAISADDGKSWSGFREVLCDLAQPAERGDRGASYSTATENRAGKVVLVAGQGDGRQAIVLFDPAWLTETRARDDFSAGIAQWTAYGATGVQVASSAARPDARELRIGRTGTEKPAGASWNFPSAASGEVTMHLRFPPGFAGARLAWTDHFSVMDDTKADENAIFVLPISRTAGLRLLERMEPERMYALSLRWRQADREAEVALDGIPIGSVARLRASGQGVNYLRVLVSAQSTEQQWLVIESVEAQIRVD